MQPYYINRSDICPRCKEQSLELFNLYNNPLHLTEAIDNGEDILLQKLNARYFKCESCGAEYPINWIGTKPIPLLPDMYKLFFSSFKLFKSN